MVTRESIQPAFDSSASQGTFANRLDLSPRLGPTNYANQLALRGSQKLIPQTAGLLGGIVLRGIHLLGAGALSLLGLSLIVDGGKRQLGKANAKLNT